MKVEVNEKQFKILYIALIIILAMPSIIYISMGKSLVNLVSDFNYMLQIAPNHNIINMIIFFILFTAINVIYICIIKKFKTTFKDTKDIFKYIIIISVLFVLILPMTSTDIFYYIATGWGDAKYNINPYYTSIKELKESENIIDDEILNKMPTVWENQKVVYGPAWPFVCKILTSLSFGSLPASLLIFKIFNLAIHLLNCLLIQKISRKKIFTLLFGLNPLILFETLTNVHNDALLLLFILLGLFFILRKKNIVCGIIALALATSIKYVAILIVPFVTIYYFRKDKVVLRILKSLGLAVIFLLVLCSIFMIYSRDLQVIQGIFTQQSKYTKSLALTVYIIFGSSEKFTKYILLSFTLFYFIQVIRYLFMKNIKISKLFNMLFLINILFLIFIVTNFQTWYVMWLFPFILWQKKSNIKSIINLSITAEVSSAIFFEFSEAFIYGTWYFCLMILSWIILNIDWRKRFGKIKKIGN